MFRSHHLVMINVVFSIIYQLFPSFIKDMNLVSDSVCIFSKLVLPASIYVLRMQSAAYPDGCGHPGAT